MNESDPTVDPVARAFQEFARVGIEREDAATPPLGSIGPYELLRVLGEGGHGTVFLAHQVSPIQSSVAVKLLRAAPGSTEAVKRFDAERQVLAQLEHPSIASIHDAGITESGQPYFAMEYVQGTSITRHCSEHVVGLRERLELFREVCAAV